MIKTISQEVYNQRMERAISIQPIRKTVPLASIDIHGPGRISVGGKRVAIEYSAFMQLARILGVPISFQKRVDKLFSEEAATSIVNKMKEAMSIHGLSTVCLVASQIEKKIISVIRNDKLIISNKTFFESIEGVISDHNLEVRDFSVNSDGGVYVNALSTGSGWDVKGLKDEYFQGGISFFNNPDDGFSVSPYINRLVCLNGAIGESFSETHRVKSISEKSISEFYEAIDRFAKRDFKPASFEKRVEIAMKTRASFAELEESAQLITSSSGLTRAEIEKWIPIVETSEKYEKHGTPTMFMTPEQKKNARTGTTIWEMINGLTHFSTHDSGALVSEPDRRWIQRKAGDILCDTHDMENMVQSPY